MLPITPVILSGGSGTRLWPSSRAGYPKQFLKLTSELSLIQQTAKRLEGLTNVSAPIVLANHKHRFLVAEHLSELEIGVESIVLEPCSRNTAPAIALAALAQIEKEDTTLLVLPADHLIRENAEFHSVIERARSYCESGKLVTFGIEVTRPATEFGYIKSGNKLVEGVFEIEGFLEKPNLETAEKLLLDQNYSWNSGIFMFKASVYIEQLKMYAPEILQACRKAFGRLRT